MQVLCAILSSRRVELTLGIIVFLFASSTELFCAPEGEIHSWTLFSKVCMSTHTGYVFIRVVLTHFVSPARSVCFSGVHTPFSCHRSHRRHICLHDIHYGVFVSPISHEGIISKSRPAAGLPATRTSSRVVIFDEPSDVEAHERRDQMMNNIPLC